MKKKGFIMHPGSWIVGAFIVGFIVAVLIARGVIPVALPICPTGG